MNWGLFWTVVGSIACVIAVVVAVIFGVLQLRHGKNSQSVHAGRDAYTAGHDQHIGKNQRSDR